MICALAVTSLAQFSPSNYSVAAPTDLDGDGKEDLVLVLDRQSVANADGRHGLVVAVSGVDGRVMFAGKPALPGTSYGHGVVTVADQSGDGVADYWLAVHAVSETEATDPVDLPGSLSMISGRDGKVLRGIVSDALPGAPGGLIALSDIDGDGHIDLGVMSRRGDQFGVVSSLTGKQLWAVSVDSFVWRTRLGVVSDLDGDDVLDVVIGSLRDDVLNGQYRGQITIYSGKSGSVLRSIPGSKVLPAHYRFTGGLAASPDKEHDIAIYAQATTLDNKNSAVFGISVTNGVSAVELPILKSASISVAGRDNAASLGEALSISHSSLGFVAIGAPRWSCIGASRADTCGLVHLYDTRKKELAGRLLPLGVTSECECFGHAVSFSVDKAGSEHGLYVLSWPCDDCTGAAEKSLALYSLPTQALKWRRTVASIVKDAAELY